MRRAWRDTAHFPIHQTSEALEVVSIAVVFNPISGTGRAAAVARRLERELRAAGRGVTLVESRPGRATDWLDASLDDAECVVVAGGDGAVRLVAARAAERGVPLWHAPCGTENLFARAFGMRARASDIVAALSRGNHRVIDIARAGSDPFAIMAGVGFDASVVHALAARRRGAISHLSYARPILSCLSTWRAPNVRWTIDGERETLGRGMVVVGNLPEYGGRLNPAAAAHPDDGLLDAVFLPADSAWSLASWVPLLWTGLHRRHPALRERRGRAIRLELSEPSWVQVDGDPSGSSAVSEVELGVHGQPLRVLLPAQA
jgi:diacylglycerol kinase (ATP)